LADRDFKPIGGVLTTLLPRSSQNGTIYSGALPQDLILGDRSECLRTETQIRAGAALFYERDRLWTAGGLKGERLARARFELNGRHRDPVGLLRLPGIGASVGGLHLRRSPGR
jgi:hypothetical protein